ncbi:DUF2383 domain-containing protein [Thermoanaerobacter sp. CM-CNRG TB177]|uniref:DUF2383 domain-containing protein n=2 Tax=Thermoanaerobacter TaxID=1754 RepID=B0KDA3_THEP3|nr:MULTISPECIES: hypothetical protein [Thermoanaerobacter]KUJ89702.1 MAG: hypothetical protein XD37_2082 [Thermoanaerobacter thermocopriae]ABY95622.1 hypothetical protein Teth39_1996 [Thermoanaerobacter pseudethanolicus ATCC 33223]ADV80560.1 hypothetical protein Thebr_2045 [Thermoanaerobacter brockii subsp. finnii Ako-1]MBT1280182.1 DUF2383 domain-containing protein [Thermoanaerobacter sp. CM-CNRG TB177]MDI3528412.1 hypothetical protein [Thermoanaerobacter sp.]
MQKITQQEIILSAFVEAQNLEKILLDKVREYGKESVDNQIKALLKQIEIMIKNHKEDIKKAQKTMHINSLVKKNMSQEPLDMLQDLLKNLVNIQAFYNETVVNITNPYVRQLFTQMRDDVMRFISILQMEIESLESKPSIPNNTVLNTPEMS